MVCTFGPGRMACMARLLSLGDVPEKTSAKEATHERTAVCTFYRQLHDADETNFLEEKDMHVFDSRPLTDPLNLVCCNACEKPIKASQFATHAETCGSINCKEYDAQEPDDGPDRKKPPRRGRKKTQATNSGSAEQKYEPVGRDTVAASESNPNDQTCMIHFQSEDAEDARGPLATKLYHSQRSHRLRVAIGQLYCQTSAKEQRNGSKCVELKRDEDVWSSQVPCLNKSSHVLCKEDFPQAKENFHLLSTSETTSKGTAL